jgi:Fanconi anemia group M protein
MSQRDQISLIEDFKAGRVNVLVATSIAEEGLDIPKVDIVIFYEPIPSEIRAIQRRGRTGRQRIGEVYILMARKTRDEAFYWSSYHREKRMREVIEKLKRSLSRPKQPSLEEYIHFKTVFARPEEFASGIVRKLADFGVIAKPKASLVPDFAIDGDLGIFRAKGGDLLERIAQAKSSYGRCLVVSEGKADKRMLAELLAEGVSFAQVEGEDEAAELIALIVENAWKNKKAP